MDKESLIIKPFLNDINGDDGAILNLRGKWCVSKDLFVEGTHFRKGWLSLKQIAAKSLLVNISDAIVMNAVPKFALLGLSLPRDISNDEISSLQKAFLKTAKKFGIKIIGGDTISSDKISISITLLSKVRKKATFRKGLKIGDLLAFTGNLGQSAKGLEILKNGGNLPKTHKFIKPKLRGEFFYKIAAKTHCVMDISDGLGQDLAKILQANKMSVKWLKKPTKSQFESGEEYEILFAFAPKNQKFIEKIARKMGVKISIFGEVRAGKFNFKGKSWHFI